MSNTPLTDSKVQRSPLRIGDEYVVPADFARSMERILRDVQTNNFPRGYGADRYQAARHFITAELAKLEAGK